MAASGRSVVFTQPKLCLKYRVCAVHTAATQNGRERAFSQTREEEDISLMKRNFREGEREREREREHDLAGYFRYFRPKDGHSRLPGETNSSLTTDVLTYSCGEAKGNEVSGSVCASDTRCVMLLSNTSTCSSVQADKIRFISRTRQKLCWQDRCQLATTSEKTIGTYSFRGKRYQKWILT